MLLSEIKEREYRFRLALRIGLPIFALITALVSHTLISSYNSLQTSFYVESVLLLAISIYFIFYLLHKGFNVKIRDDVSGAFSREYLDEYLQKEIKEQKEYTLSLISIDNLYEINQTYGMKNGDKILKEVVERVAEYFNNEGIFHLPIGHLKGGDFIIGLSGLKEKYMTPVELFCLKSTEFSVDNIEVKISASITDTTHSRDLNYLIENLFYLQENNKKKKSDYKDESIDPNELELYVIDAIKKRSLSIATQAVFENGKHVFDECFLKLKISDKQYLYPKRYMKIINKLGLWMEFDLMVIEELLVNVDTIGETTFAVNVSPSSLRNEKFLHTLKELLQEQNKKIIFILSELEYYSYTERYNSILKSLRKLGVSIVIDRVGSLHSSFLYLRELDIDMIRIDTYYSHEKKMRENHSIINGLNLMAQEKGIKTWIKNLEDELSLEQAKEMKIDLLQGKYLAKLVQLGE